MDDPAPRVFVVIVTYHRLRFLRLALEAVRSQTHVPHRILVVNNGSDPETARYLEDQARNGVETLHVPENVGPAGGFALGLERADREDATHVWLMDDDVVCASDVLERLVEAAGDGAVAFPDTVDGRARAFENFAWSGVVVPMPIVRAMGVPLRGYFYWKEDTEYFAHRIHGRGGYPIVRVREAEVLHLVFRSLRLSAPVYYYRARNELDYAWRVRQQGRAKAVVRLSRLFARILLLENGKLHKTRMVLRGIRDARAGRLGKLD